MKKAYSNAILNQTPRLISLIDRNSYSSTYGCFDRSFWHSQLTDFPSARFQEACLTLALLYKQQYPNNIYYQNPKIEQWAVAAIKYWQKIQSTNGSFNEWYPNEHSFVATAFTLYAVTETYLLLKLNSASLINSIKKSADWLSSQTETSASNQQAGAVIALYNTFLLTKQKKYRQIAKAKLTQLIKTQSKEGWFPEYGGADIGYSSVLLDYLAKYYQKSKDKQALIATQKLLQFLKYFIHPNQTTGGSYGSRNTEYLLADGFEILSRLNQPAAQAISSSILAHLCQYHVNLDDRYLCYTGYTFLQAYNHYSKRKNSLYLYQQNFSKFFKQSGIYIYSNPQYYCLINLKKGGTIMIYSKKNQKLIFESSGIIGSLFNNQIISSQWLDSNYQIKINQNKISVTGKLHQVNPMKISTLIFILSRLFQLSLGRSQLISLNLKKILRKKLILKSKTIPVKFTRQFNFNQKTIQIINELQIMNKIKFKSLSFNHKFSLIYVPSTRYFQQQQLELKTNRLKKEAINNLNKTKRLSLKEEIKV